MISNFRMFRSHHSSIIGFNKSVNQDSHAIYENSKYLLIIVADGLGTASKSDIGSLQAIKAVRKAIIEWRNLMNENSNILLQLVHFYWQLYINDLGLEKKDCLTTCLFVYIDKEKNTGLTCQLGDGLILLKSNNYLYLTQNIKDFNYTKSLGCTKNINDWIVNFINFNTKSVSLYLMTDGISDDIKNGKEEEFLEYLIATMNKIKKNDCNRFLKHILKNWPTKFHSDDKTLCVAWR